MKLVIVSLSLIAISLIGANIAYADTMISSSGTGAAAAASASGSGVAAAATSDNNHPKTILKCDNEKDQCIGWCSTANVDGTETTFCFTKKACNEFRIDNDGTKCKKTIIHD